VIATNFDHSDYIYLSIGKFRCRLIKNHPCAGGNVSLNLCSQALKPVGDPLFVNFVLLLLQQIRTESYQRAADRADDYGRFPR